MRNHVSAVLAAVLILLIVPARAADAPKFATDMTTVLLTEGGTPMQDDLAIDPKTGEACGTYAKVGENPHQRTSLDGCPSLTLGHAVAHALYQPDRGTSGAAAPVAPEQQAARGELGKRVRDDKAATLTDGEVKVIEKMLAQVYSPLVLSQAIPLLSPTRLPDVQ